MQIRHAKTEFVLRENHPLAARHARGITIRCTAGQLWITVSGNAEDVFLNQGEIWICDANGLLLIEAIDEARLAFDLPIPAARRLISKLQALIRYRREINPVQNTGCRLSP